MAEKTDVKAEAIYVAEEIEVAPEQPKADPESGDVKKVDDIDDDDDAGLPLREISIGPLSFNPVVSVVGLVPLWGLAGYCMSQPDAAKALLDTWFANVIDAFTWFYIGTLSILCVNYVCVYTAIWDGDSCPRSDLTNDTKLSFA
jgi:hypothetical protein